MFEAPSGGTRNDMGVIDQVKNYARRLIGGYYH
jgi:hypothetical protein